MADEEVKIFEASDKEITASNRAGVCYFCCKNFSKYTCPRCNSSYCSVLCYNDEKHLHCSEGFFKENVVGELSQRSKDPEDVQKILKMLKDLEDEAIEDDKQDKPSLEERFSNVNLEDVDPDLIWKTLTEDEKREFESSLKSGHLSQMIEEWIPWWQPSNVQRKVNIQELKSKDGKNEEIEKQSDSTKTKKHFQNSQRFPKILHKVQQLTAPTSPLIKYSIIDVLYAYAYTMKLYNGSPLENPEQSSHTLYTLSSSLSKAQTFDNLESVIQNSLNNVLESNDLFNSQEFSYSVLLDVINLMEGSFKQDDKVISFIDCALSDAHRIIEKGRKALKNNTESFEDEVKGLWLAKKKLEFFLSWMQSNRDVIYSFVPPLRTVYFELMTNSEVHESQKRKLKAKWKRSKPPSSKKLIEEI